MTEPRTDEGWYRWREGVHVGPYTWEALYSLAVEGGLRPDDQVWHEILSTRADGREVPGFFPDQVVPRRVSSDAPVPGLGDQLAVAPRLGGSLAGPMDYVGLCRGRVCADHTLSTAQR